MQRFIFKILEIKYIEFKSLETFNSIQNQKYVFFLNSYKPI